MQHENLFVDNMTPDILRVLYEENGASAFIIGITKEHIEENNYEYVESFVKSIESFEHGKDNKFIITTNAYDLDPRELFQIDEWVKYLDYLIKKVPRLFYHVERPSKSLIIQCLCTDIILQKNKDTYTNSLNRYKLHNLLGIVGDCLNPEETNEVLEEIKQILK